MLTGSKLTEKISLEIYSKLSSNAFLWRTGVEIQNYLDSKRWLDSRADPSGSFVICLSLVCSKFKVWKFNPSKYFEMQSRVRVKLKIFFQKKLFKAKIRQRMTKSSMFVWSQRNDLRNKLICKEDSSKSISTRNSEFRMWQLSQKNERCHQIGSSIRVYCKIKIP